MRVDFDKEVGFEGALLIGWANVSNRRIRCLAGRETINELPDFTHSSAAEIRNRKHEVFEQLKPAFVGKIERGELDRSNIPSVTVYLQDLSALR